MTQPNIFQEIDDDLDRQKMEALWRRFGPYIIAGALAIIIVTAAVTSWRSWKAQRNQNATDQLMDVLREADTSKAQELKDLDAFIVANPGTVQATLARIYDAGIVAKDGDTQKALALYDAVAHDASADTALRQLADLMAVQIQIDTADPAVLRARLKPLLADGAPWRYTALEYEGHLALKAGDKAAARQAFSSLEHDGNAPTHLSDSAGDMLRYIGD